MTTEPSLGLVNRKETNTDGGLLLQGNAYVDSPVQAGLLPSKALGKAWGRNVVGELNK